ncbi:MAG TPA: sugar transferase, partial [Methylomirabilota bacterium]|nr:sugar transferase [Methylomirabilota bacterium]
MTIQETGSAFERTATPPRQGLGARARSIATAFSDQAIPPPLASGLAAAFEAIVLSAVPILAVALWMGQMGVIGGPIVVSAILTTLVLKGGGGYGLEAMRRHQIRLGRTLATWSAVFGGMTVAVLVGDFLPNVPKSVFPIWYLGGVAALALSGALIATEFRRQTAAGRLQRRAVIVGGGPAADTLIAALERDGGNELKILGIFDDRDDRRSPDSQKDYPKLGTTADLVDFGRLAAVDLLIVSIPMSAETRLLQLLKQLWVLPVDIRLAAHDNKLRLRPRSYSYVGRVPFLDVFDRPIAGWDSVSKRIFDVIFASLAIVCLSPVMLAVAAAIRLDSPGPALFRQKRYGFNNEVIDVLKFRSMRHDMADPTARTVVTRGDPRV